MCDYYLITKEIPLSRIHLKVFGEERIKNLFVNLKFRRYIPQLRISELSLIAILALIHLPAHPLYPILFMESWLKESGAVGLDDLELANFHVTGRGIRSLQYHKEGERLLTIPSGNLWTVDHAYADALLGPALRSVQPPLAVEDTLATYILFVQSRKSGYDGLRSHVTALPTSYSSSIFFTEDELDVCAGTSLYTVTKQLKRQIEEDYAALVARILGRYQDLFPRDEFTIEDVGGTCMMDVTNQMLSCISLTFSISGLSPLYGVVGWILCCRMGIRFDCWHHSRTC